MPPRPALKSKSHTANRLSAVYIGPSALPNSQILPQFQTPQHYSSPPFVSRDSSGIPDLPEPPSPGASSSGSGLPSPPATNSTGSGSTGDPMSVAVRGRTLEFEGSSSGGTASIHSNTNVFKSAAGVLHRRSGSLASTIGSVVGRPAGQDSIEEGEWGDEDGYGDSHNNGRSISQDDEEGDDTARLNLRLNENTLALQRVRSLTLRNRMVLDKLSSYPRTSPVPSHTSHTSSSASGSSTSKSSKPSSNSSRVSRPLSSHSSQPKSKLQGSHTHSYSLPSHVDQDAAQQDQGLSGSETERESSFHSSTNSTNSYSNTSNSGIYSHPYRSSSQTHLRAASMHNPVYDPPHTRTRTPPTPHRRTRVPSAPTSPLKALGLTRTTSTRTESSAASSSSGPALSNASSPRARKRVSLALLDDYPDGQEHRGPYGPGGTGRAKSSLALTTPEAGTQRGRDVTVVAMEAVAKSRRKSSPPGVGAGTGRKRGALPFEFRGDLNGGGVTNADPEPITPYRSKHLNSSTSTLNHTSTFTRPESSAGNRSATVRERRGQTKWASEDLSATSTSPSAEQPPPSARSTYTRDRRDSVMGMGEYRERRQSLRGGSAESALAGPSGGRSFFGEGLRAAGLSPRKDRARGMGRTEGGTLGRSAGAGGDVFAGDDGTEYEDEAGGRPRVRAVGTARAATSMADYRYLGRADRDEDEDRTGEPSRGLRGSKSAYPLRANGGRAGEERKEGDRETDRAASVLSRYESTRPVDGGGQGQTRYASPIGSRRYTALVPANGAGGMTGGQQPEHTRLLMESLSIFEGHISRLGVGGAGSGGGAELVRTAQGVAGAAERLNGMLRYGVSRALEEQVDAEVDDGERGARNIADLWKRVGGEYREGQRVSDELVRGLTGLLLGLGKVVRDLVAVGGPGEGHGRSLSLDEEGLSAGRRVSASPDVGNEGSTGGSGSGRRSTTSRHSWDPAADTMRGDAPRHLVPKAENPRPSSAFNLLRGDRTMDRRYDTPPPLSAPPPRQSIGNTQSMRRLFTPREQREKQLDAAAARVAADDSHEAIYAHYEPSPTPAPRTNQGLERTRTLPPKPLGALPSESLRRNKTIPSKPTATATPTGTVRDRERRKTSATATPTVRVNNGGFPASLTTPSSATTALTAHTVSTEHMPDRTAFPSTGRAPDGGDGDGGRRGAAVTFSRPSTVSVNALNGVQQQHLEQQRKRTGSGASSGVEPSTSVPPSRGVQIQKDVRRKTVAGRAGRVSLDGSGGDMGLAGAGAGGSKTVHAADRSAAVAALGMGGGGMLPPMNTAKRERRRTVTEIWVRD